MIVEIPANADITEYETLLLREILPEVDWRYGATAERGLWGALLGGLVSVWLARRNRLSSRK